MNTEPHADQSMACFWSVSLIKSQLCKIERGFYKAQTQGGILEYCVTLNVCSMGINIDNNPFNFETVGCFFIVLNRIFPESDSTRSAVNDYQALNPFT